MDYYDVKKDIINRMEWIIGKHCTNSMGNFRYPVKYRHNGKIQEGKCKVNVPWNDIPSMYYQFGSNKVKIGDALIEILDYLEKINPDIIWELMDKLEEDE
ncbi:MAG: hypothetical protein J5476_04115 [Lachnospiraceae bacterium]|nr:hypothetical protein [Lachnospiraceae bacterium]